MPVAGCDGTSVGHIKRNGALLNDTCRQVRMLYPSRFDLKNAIESVTQMLNDTRKRDKIWRRKLEGRLHTTHITHRDHGRVASSLERPRARAEEWPWLCCWNFWTSPQPPILRLSVHLLKIRTYCPKRWIPVQMPAKPQCRRFAALVISNGALDVQIS